MEGRMLPGEGEAISRVLSYGAAYGYGNLIHQLRVAWAGDLARAGLDEGTARYHVGLAESPDEGRRLTKADIDAELAMHRINGTDEV